MPAPSPPGLVGGELGDSTGQPEQPATPSLTAGTVGSDQPSPPNIPEPPNLGLLTVTPDGAPILHGFGIQSEYVWDEGTRSLPIAGPPGGPSFSEVTLHRRQCRKVVTFVCQALNGRPPVPHRDTGSANERYRGRRLSLATPTPMPGGDQAFTIVGQYIYDLVYPPSDTDELGGAKHPLSSVPAALNSLRVQDYVHLLAAAQATGSGG